MTCENEIWHPIEFDSGWLNVNTEQFDNIRLSWERKREEFKKNPNEYERFLSELKRKQAIDTGVLERLYDLKEGVTETLIKEGFLKSYVQHGDTNIDTNLLMRYLKDNSDAIDFIFDFVKNNRLISTGYIKELHALITRNQEYTEAIDPFGNRIHARMIKGDFKILPNNPKREDDDVKFIYCPPEQVASEMDNLIRIYNEQFDNRVHVISKAAFFHHAFTQIHPFQDGNGRIARLLASLILIKEGLFPLTIDRKEKKEYINVLEKADTGEYQPLVNVFCNNQINNIEKALNWKTVTPEAGYNEIVSIFTDKVKQFKNEEQKVRNRTIASNRLDVFNNSLNAVKNYTNNLKLQLGGFAEINVFSNNPNEDKYYYYAHQIAEFASQHGYYFNASQLRGWIKVSIKLSEKKEYNLIITIHHYGYDNSTLAIGSFLQYVVAEEITPKIKEKSNKQNSDNQPITIPLVMRPLTISAEKNVITLKSSIDQYIQDIITVTLAYLANEL